MILLEIVSLLKVVSPYVIPLIDVEMSNRSTALVLPLAETSLDDEMIKPNLDSRSVFRQICLGLAAIHNSNLLHLDMKPDNILFRNGVVQIIDLGLSQLHTCAMKPRNEAAATLWYRPPEILLNGYITPKVDVWSIGVILAEMLISSKRKERYYLLQGKDDLDQLRMTFALVGTPSQQILRRLTDQVIKPQVGNLRSILNIEQLGQDEIDFLVYILNPDYTLRPSIFQLLHHPWMQEVNSPEQLSCREVLVAYSHHPKNEWPSQDNLVASRRLILDIASKEKLGGEEISTSIYLIDRLVSLNQVTMDSVADWICACLYLSIEMYTQPYIPLSRLLNYFPTLTVNYVQDIAKKILQLTSFDLAASSPFLFLSLISDQQDIPVEIITLWKASMFLDFYFQPPSVVADAIVDLVNNPLTLTSQAELLYRQILVSQLDLDEIRHGQQVLDRYESAIYDKITQEYPDHLDLKPESMSYQEFDSILLRSTPITIATSNLIDYLPSLLLNVETILDEVGSQHPTSLVLMASNRIIGLIKPNVEILPDEQPDTVIIVDGSNLDPSCRDLDLRHILYRSSIEIDAKVEKEFRLLSDNDLCGLVDLLVRLNKI